jgi:hypothetical protein
VVISINSAIGFCFSSDRFIGRVFRFAIGLGGYG